MELIDARDAFSHHRIPHVRCSNVNLYNIHIVHLVLASQNWHNQAKVHRFITV